MEANLLFLRNFGFSDGKIRKLVLTYPNYLTQKPERIKDLLYRMENDFQVPCDSPFFNYGFHTLASQKKSVLDRKIQIFKSFGWSDHDILQMFLKSPYYIGFLEVRIWQKLNLFMKELGLGPAYMVSHIGVLICSLEKRVVPRLRVLKILDKKKLERRKLALSSVLSISELKFMKYFVLPYNDEIPDLYEPLQKNVDCRCFDGIAAPNHSLKAKCRNLLYSWSNFSPTTFWISLAPYL